MQMVPIVAALANDDPTSTDIAEHSRNDSGVNHRGRMGHDEGDGPAGPPQRGQYADEHEGHHHGPRGPYAAGRTARHRAQRAPANQPIPHEQQHTNEQRGNNRPAEGDAGKQHRTEQQHRARFQHAILSSSGYSLISDSIS